MSFGNLCNKQGDKIEKQKHNKKIITKCLEIRNEFYNFVTQINFFYHYK